MGAQLPTRCCCACLPAAAHRASTSCAYGGPSKNRTHTRSCVHGQPRAAACASTRARSRASLADKLPLAPSPSSSQTGGGNAQKSAMARAKKQAAEAGKGKGSQLEANAKAMSLQCAPARPRPCAARSRRRPQSLPGCSRRVVRRLCRSATRASAGEPRRRASPLRRCRCKICFATFVCTSSEARAAPCRPAAPRRGAGGGAVRRRTREEPPRDGCCVAARRVGR